MLDDTAFDPPPTQLKGSGRVPDGAKDALRDLTPSDVVTITPVDDAQAEKIFSYVAPDNPSEADRDRIAADIRALKSAVLIKRENDAAPSWRYSVEPPEVLEERLKSKHHVPLTRVEGHKTKAGPTYSPAQLAVLGMLGAASAGAGGLTAYQQWQETKGEAETYSQEWWNATATTGILNILAIFGLLAGGHRTAGSFRDGNPIEGAAKLATLAVALGAIYHNTSVTGAWQSTDVADQRTDLHADYETKRALADEADTLDATITRLSGRITALNEREAALAQPSDDPDADRLLGLQNRETALLDRFDGVEPRALASEDAFLTALTQFDGYSSRNGGGRAANPNDTATLEAEQTAHAQLRDVRTRIAEIEDRQRAGDAAAAVELAATRDELATLRADITAAQTRRAEIRDELAPLAEIDLSIDVDAQNRTEEQLSIGARENAYLQLFGYFGFLVIAQMGGGRRRDDTFIFDDPDTGAPMLTLDEDGQASFLRYQPDGRLSHIERVQLDPDLVAPFFAHEPPEPVAVAAVVDAMNTTLRETFPHSGVELRFTNNGEVELGDAAHDRLAPGGSTPYSAPARA